MIGHRITLDTGFDEAIGRVERALAEQGFGVITRIEMHKTFAEKLGVAFRPYTILGACNPKLAHRAISEVPEVGLLLPCNVTVEKVDDGVRVCLPDAQEMLGGAGLEGGPALKELAEDAGARLDQVAQALSA
ncbi:DUF302 domain-containing protein [Cribrihabitans sp. XS_ASV171]